MQEKIVDWFAELVLTMGVYALGIGAALESFGIPFASSVIDVFAGAFIVKGRYSFPYILLIVVIGKTIGSAASYGLGRYFAAFMENRWPSISEKILSSGLKERLQDRGSLGIFLAQLFGPTRTWISYFAGTMGLDFPRFILLSGLGGAVFFSAVIAASWLATGFLFSGYLEVIAEYSILLAVLTLAASSFAVYWFFFLRSKS